MWVFLNNAFMSAVQDPMVRHGLVVRARLKGDLQRVFPKAKVFETRGRDYRWRVFVTKQQFANVLSKAALAINYGNFKDSVRENARHDAYLGVWGVMNRAQQDELNPPPKRNPAQQRLALSAPDRSLGDYSGDPYSLDWDGPHHRRPLG